MIHAFFVTIGVLAAIWLFPLIVALIGTALVSWLFWYCVLWVLALLAAIAGFSYALIPMAITVPFLFIRLVLRERTERREIALGIRKFNGDLIQNREAIPQRKNPPDNGYYCLPRNFTPKEEQVQQNRGNRAWPYSIR